MSLHENPWKNASLMAIYVAFTRVTNSKYLRVWPAQSLTKDLERLRNLKYPLPVILLSKAYDSVGRFSEDLYKLAYDEYMVNIKPEEKPIRKQNSSRTESKIKRGKQMGVVPGNRTTPRATIAETHTREVVGRCIDLASENIDDPNTSEKKRKLPWERGSHERKILNFSGKSSTLSSATSKRDRQLTQELSEQEASNKQREGQSATDSSISKKTRSEASPTLPHNQLQPSIDDLIILHGERRKTNSTIYMSFLRYAFEVTPVERLRNTDSEIIRILEDKWSGGTTMISSLNEIKHAYENLGIFDSIKTSEFFKKNMSLYIDQFNQEFLLGIIEDFVNYCDKQPADNDLVPIYRNMYGSSTSSNTATQVRIIETVGLMLGGTINSINIRYDDLK